MSYANKIYIFLNFRKNVVQKNFVLVNWMFRKNFRSILRHDWSQKSREDVHIDFRWSGELCSVSMNFQKSSFVCVSARRIWSKRRTTIPFALQDRYDYKGACKSKFHVMGGYKNFLEGSEVAVVLLWNSLIEVTKRGRTSDWVWLSKNNHLLAFLPIEYDLSVVRPCRLLWEIDMIMRKFANTNLILWEATENFLTALKSLSPLYETLLLKSLRGVELVFEYNFPKITICLPFRL